MLRYTVSARVFGGEAAARSAWETLLAHTRGASSLYRFCLDGRHTVAIVADDVQALAEAERAWSAGEPVSLPQGVIEQLCKRRRRQAPTRPGACWVRRAADALRFAPILGCVCADEASARALYEQLVAELLPELEGALVVFAEPEGWVVAAVTDTAASARLTGEALLSRGGNCDWHPSVPRVAELMALRAGAGQAPFPQSFEGVAAVGQPLVGVPTERTVVHPPTRRQPCPCGSNRRYKNCCGRR